MQEIDDEKVYISKQYVSILLETLQRAVVGLDGIISDFKRASGINELEKGEAQSTVGGLSNEEIETRYSMEHRDCCPELGEGRG